MFDTIVGLQANHKLHYGFRSNQANTQNPTKNYQAYIHHFSLRHPLLRQMYESQIVQHERVSTPKGSHLLINIIINNLIINNQ